MLNQLKKSKITSSKILKTVIDNTNNHLNSIDKTLRENNRRIAEMMTMEKMSPNILNLLVEIKKNNSAIIVDNTVFKAVEVVIDEDDCN
jgi:hypothetical protein